MRARVFVSKGPEGGWRDEEEKEESERDVADAGEANTKHPAQRTRPVQARRFGSLFAQRTNKELNARVPEALVRLSPFSSPSLCVTNVTLSLRFTVWRTYLTGFELPEIANSGKTDARPKRECFCFGYVLGNRVQVQRCTWEPVK